MNVTNKEKEKEGHSEHEVGNGNKKNGNKREGERERGRERRGER